MKFNIGDRITFINEKQEGIVKADLGNQVLRVEIDDGFEIDIHEKELALIYGRHNQLVQNRETEKALDIEPVQAERYALPKTKFGEVYWVSMPADQETMMSGPVSFILRNDLAVAALVIIFIKRGGEFTELYSNKVDAGQEVFITAKRREEMSDWQGFRAELSVLDPALKMDAGKARTDFKLLLPDLDASKSRHSKPADYARVISIYSTGKNEEVDLQKLKMKFEGTLAGNPALTSTFKNFESTDRIKEVDLHINYSSSGISKLEEQLKIFREELNKAVLTGVNSIVFIHGVGDGILRSRLLLELEKYESFTSKDAPENKYGKGALQVDLH